MKLFYFMATVRQHKRASARFPSELTEKGRTRVKAGSWVGMQRRKGRLCVQGFSFLPKSCTWSSCGTLGFQATQYESTSIEKYSELHWYKPDLVRIPFLSSYLLPPMSVFLHLVYSAYSRRKEHNVYVCVMHLFWYSVICENQFIYCIIIHIFTKIWNASWIYLPWCMKNI